MGRSSGTRVETPGARRVGGDNHGYKRHCLHQKPQKMKRKARGTTTLAAPDAHMVKKYLPYG